MGTQGPEWPLETFGDMETSLWPHLVELDRAEDVNAFGEELLDVAEQVGVHGGAGDGDSRTVRDTGTVKYLRKPGDVGPGAQALPGDKRMGTQRCRDGQGTRGRFRDTGTVWGHKDKGT